MNSTATDTGTEPGIEAMPAIEGPSFPLTGRLLATGVLGLLGVLGVQAAGAGGWDGVGSDQWLLSGLAVFAVCLGWWHVMTCRTRIADGRISHSAPWGRTIDLADVTQVKLIRVPGLSALIVPRLVVRTRGNGTTTFHAGNERLVAAFRLLAHGH
ncbi:hypothetical protein [Piscinibacter sakaiensis]|uniref:hypothetical protein n=1 Tax=Piscinibacter sakaiensis TaxID=1547922 RepID=UPI003AAAF476